MSHYVRRSSNLTDGRPYQVRVNLPDQTYRVVSTWQTRCAATHAAHLANMDVPAPLERRAPGRQIDRCPHCWGEHRGPNATAPCRGVLEMAR